ncbi:3-deoxy-D-manno-octulosonic acid transferase [Bacteroidia bacterium]|nr:3-deoxy-D-manno-octulosonic acid transferase [Bacteroidia bacterium]
MYGIIIALYALIVRLVSPFNKKAKLMIEGQKKTFAVLKQQIDSEARYIWFHAASLGEFEQGRPLIEKIKKEKPEYKILLTFFSPSGYEVRKNYSQADVVCYLPFDLKRNVRKFLSLVNPEMAIFIKYEFWRNYLTLLKKRNIPTFIISAIFRPNQIFFRPYGRNYRKVLKNYEHLFVQDENSKKLLAKYGVHNVSITGDTRFDRAQEIYEQRKNLPLIEAFVQSAEKEESMVLVAGSTWPKDEDLILPYFNEHAEIKLILAPHELHGNHVQEIRSHLKRSVVLYSQANETNIKEADCLIIDCYGILSSIYRYGKIAYIGGGFGNGIHNVLEAAVYGVPVLFGPNFHRFKEAQDLITAGGGISISNADQFNSRINELTAYSHLLLETGEKAGKFVQEHTGATDKIFRYLYR